MAATFKIPYARRAGKLIHIDTVNRGLQFDCTCPACGAALVARKGAKVSHHFAHAGPTNCRPETAAHVIAKSLLAERISRAIKEDKQIPMRWKCTKCHGTHSGDLVKRAVRIEVEFFLNPCRPDLTLFDAHGKAIAIIEIIVTHKPEDSVREYCKRNNIALVEYQIDSEKDLEDIEADMFEPDRVSSCTSKKCPRCSEPLSPVLLIVVDGNCWKCKSPMRIAYSDTDGMYSGPTDFTKLQQDLAEQQGAVLRENYSKTREESYVSNSCPTCHAFIGDFYLHEHLPEEPISTGITTGYQCLNCDHRIDLKTQKKS